MVDITYRAKKACSGSLIIEWKEWTMTAEGNVFLCTTFQVKLLKMSNRLKMRAQNSFHKEIDFD